MPIIERVRPQSKRKALNAAAFATRYRGEAKQAVDSGNHALAEKLHAKSEYWQARYDRWAANL